SRRFAFAQRLAGRFGRIFSFRGTPGWLRLPAFTGWGLRRDLPAPDPRPFRRRWAALHASRQDNSKVQAFSPADQITPSEKAEKDQMAYPITEDVNGSSSLLERFVTEAAERACQVSICSSVELADRLISLLRERSIPSLLTWEAPHLPSGLLEALGQAGLSLTHTPNPHAQAGL